MDGEITAEALRELLDEGVRVVDIRSPAQFRRGHIPDSENVPLAELTNRVEAFAGADRVVTVCPHGQASVQAARLIGSFEGFEGRVDSLSSGLEGWPYDLETGDGAAAKDGSTPDAPF